MVSAIDDDHPPAPQSRDDGHLPQRPAHVERTREDPHHQLAEHGAVARGRQHFAAHVRTEVEMRIVDPHRVRKVQRRPLDALAISRDQVDALLDRFLDA